MEKLNKECLEYFKVTPGFSRVFEEMRKKYISLGRIGGTIQLNNLTEVERSTLSGFLRKDYYYKKSVTLSIERLQKALIDTRYEGVNLEEILLGYFEDEIVTNKAKQEKEITERSTFFEGVLREFEGTPANTWLKNILDNKISGVHQYLSANYNSSPKTLKANLIKALKGYNEAIKLYLNSEKELLPIFASKVTKDPHAFDENTEANKILTYCLTSFLKVKDPKNAEEKTALLYEVGIIRDELSNFTITSGLLARTKDGNIHPGWSGFYDLNEPIHLSLKNLSNIEEIYSPHKKVYLFENPAVFNTVQGRFGCSVSIVCTYGQIKLASLLLMDKLKQSGTILYYHGDFDIKGLEIASKLKDRYCDSLIFIGYNEENYYNSLSDKKIHTINKSFIYPELEMIKNLIRKEKRVGYQELIVDKLINEIY